LAEVAGPQTQLRAAVDGEAERVEWVGGGFGVPGRQVQVERGVAYVGMAEYDLQSRQVSAGFEQVGGETVSAMPHAA
jgi:hypothetical protein